MPESKGNRHSAFLDLGKEFKLYSFGIGETFNDFKQARDKLRFAYLNVP